MTGNQLSLQQLAIFYLNRGDMKILFLTMMLVGCGQQPIGDTKGTLTVIVDIIKASKILGKRQRMIDNLIKLVNKKVGVDIVMESIATPGIQHKAQDKALRQLITEKNLDIKAIFEDVNIQIGHRDSPYWSPIISEASKKRTDELHAILKRYIETAN